MLALRIPLYSFGADGRQSFLYRIGEELPVIRPQINRSCDWSLELHPPRVLGGVKWGGPKNHLVVGKAAFRVLPMQL
jgi:hypothetical protein